MDTPSYYAPFTTSNEAIPDSDSESDTSSDSGSYNGFTDSTAKGLDDPRYAIVRAAGPNFNTFPIQSFYHMGLGSPYNEDDIYDPSTNIPLRLPFLPFTPPNRTTTSSLFSFSSSQRDKDIYPLSTFFTLKTPRTYKNITQIQFVQINFPVFTNSITDASSLKVEIAKYVSSNTNYTFSNCYACIGNTGGGGRGLTTSLNGGSFSEAGRVNPVATSKPLTHTFSLRGGAYDPGTMVNEMDKQLNSTPPFNIISYQEHRQLFLTKGTADHLFNEPGKWYFSPSSSTYIRSASKSLVISDYLPNTTLASMQPTEREIFVAYFFPVLRAALFSTYDNKFLDLGSESLASVNQRVLSAYEGLASPFYYELCYNNLTVLKSIRRVHTFEYNPINSYNYTYSPSDNRVSVTHTDLHPSLQKDIQSFYESSKLKMAAALGYTGREFNNLQTQVQQSNSIVADLSKQIQTALVEVGVPLYTYTDAQIADPTTPLYMQSKKSLAPSQTTESDDALIALTLGPPSSLSPPATIKRSFPATFGWSTVQQLLVDASAAITAAPGSRVFTGPYMQHLQSLNQCSQMKQIGKVPVGCTDFPALYSTFVNYYSTNTGLVTTAGDIQSKSLALTSNYVNNKYGTVLPTSILLNNNYLNGKGTGGVTFYGSKSIHYASTPDESDTRGFNIVNDLSGCCAYIAAAIQNFYGCLPSEYVITTPFYKLGYGINDIFSFYSTNTLTTTTSVNNIYVELNEEYSLNNMDIAGIEDRTISTESTGQYKRVFGKILTQGLNSGATAQTIIQVPAKFPISPLASLDHFSFQFYLDTMVPLNKLYPFLTSGTDWNAIMQIDEQVGVFNG